MLVIATTGSDRLRLSWCMETTWQQRAASVMKRKSVLWSAIIVAEMFAVVAGCSRSVDKRQIIYGSFEKCLSSSLSFPSTGQVPTVTAIGLFSPLLAVAKTLEFPRLSNLRIVLSASRVAYKLSPSSNVMLRIDG